VAMRPAALVSDESALEACLRRCAIQIDDFYLYLYIFESDFILANSSIILSCVCDLNQWEEHTHVLLQPLVLRGDLE